MGRMISKVRVLVVDAHPVVRSGLFGFFALSGQVEVVGEAVDEKQAAELCHRLKPDVVTIDALATSVGGERVRTSNGSQPDFGAAKLLLFSDSLREETILRAVEAGAKGCLLKSASREELIGAIMTIHQGGECFPAAVARKLSEHRLRTGLSPREFQVLRLVVDGMSNKEIVSRLRLSEATIKLHISNMLNKLGVTDRTQAAVAALRRGIVHLEG
jgi:DNA-binding NarL/FixJ family response regulator